MARKRLLLFEFPAHSKIVEESQESNGSTTRGCLPKAVTRPPPTQRKTMIEIGTVKQNSVITFCGTVPISVMVFRPLLPRKYSLRSPPGRGQGDAPKARGSEWYTNNPKYFFTASLLCNFHIKPESIYFYFFIRLITHEKCTEGR